MADLTESVEQGARLVACANRIVFLTGAGISTDSGIPDFRSPGGLWTRYDPRQLTYQRFLASHETRRLYWEMAREIYPVLRDAEPNLAHRGIVRLQDLQKLRCVVTQNIDGLHQKAGLEPGKVIEIHGTALSVVCLSCGLRLTREEIHRRMENGGEDIPMCNECGGFLKPATVSFGQPMPEEETREAFAQACACDLFIVIGSSLAVMPAAELPAVAVRAGAPLIIINREPTPLDGMARLLLRESATVVMNQLMVALGRVLRG